MFRLASSTLPFLVRAAWHPRSLAFSTTANSVAVGTTAGCPVAGGRGRANGTGAAAPKQQHPTLKGLPHVPIFGICVSAIPAMGDFLNRHFCKNPVIVPDNACEFQCTLCERCGTFCTTCIPGVGQQDGSLHPRVHMIVDPGEMKKSHLARRGLSLW